MTSRNLLRSRPQPEAQTDVAPWIADLRSRSTKGAVPWRSLLGAFLVLLVLGLTVEFAVAAPTPRSWASGLALLRGRVGSRT